MTTNDVPVSLLSIDRLLAELTAQRAVAHERGDAYHVEVLGDVVIVYDGPADFLYVIRPNDHGLYINETYSR